MYIIDALLMLVLAISFIGPPALIGFIIFMEVKDYKDQRAQKAASDTASLFSLAEYQAKLYDELEKQPEEVASRVKAKLSERRFARILQSGRMIELPEALHDDERLANFLETHSDYKLKAWNSRLYIVAESREAATMALLAI